MAAATSRRAFGLVLAAASLVATGIAPAAAEIVTAPQGPQPNPPAWPDSVRVFGPEDSAADIETAVNAAYEENGGGANHGQFSSKRFAFLFKPGTYNANVPVGYYTQVLGLGQDPDDVLFHPPRGVDASLSRHTEMNEEVNLAENEFRGVYVEEGNKANKFGALSTFWRGAENFRVASDMLWATAQACPVRRVIVDGTLQLAEYVLGVGMGYSSGGFIANVEVRGPAVFASQQQYMSRNVAFGGEVQGGVWNMVYVGSQGAPAGQCRHTDGQAGTVSVEETPVVAEKPFISADAAGKYHLNVPQVRRGRTGTDWSPGKRFSFENVFVARDTDSAQAINEQLGRGLHVVLSPGTYRLEAPLELRVPGQVLLGIGLATLVPSGGGPAVKVDAAAAGARVAGLLLEAGEERSEALLIWGEEGSRDGDPNNPGFIHDVFGRVGGANDPLEMQAHAETMVKIFSSHVVGDNLWLWRADHGVSGITRQRDNPCSTGLVVSGDNVTMYGLAVEHTLEDLVVWSGDGGQTYFYQSELPYDVDQSYGDANYAGYRVTGEVRTHSAWGVGVYHFFRDHEVVVKTGIDVPPWLENSFHSPVGVMLNGRGRMLHIINDKGGETSRGNTQARYYCDRSPDAPFEPYTTTVTTTTVLTTRTTTTRTTTSTSSRTTTTSTRTTTTPTGTSTATSTATTTTTTATNTGTTSTTTTSTYTVTSSTTSTTSTWTVTTTVSTTTTTWTTTTVTSTSTTTTGAPALLMGLPLGSALAAQAVVASLALVYCCVRKKARRAGAAQELQLFDREAPFQLCRVESASPDRGDRRRPMTPSSPPPRQRSESAAMWESITSPLHRSFSKHTVRDLSVSSLNMTGLSLSPGPCDRDLRGSALSPWNGVSSSIRRNSVPCVREEPGP